jgi:hypothetical protein
MTTKKTSWWTVLSLLFALSISLVMFFLIGYSAVHGYWTQGIFWVLLYALHRDIVTKRLMED